VPPPSVKRAKTSADRQKRKTTGITPAPLKPGLLEYFELTEEIGRYLEAPSVTTLAGEASSITLLLR
jgi:hypothetical protein